MARAPESFETERLRAERSHGGHLALYVAFEQDARIAAWLGGAPSVHEAKERLGDELAHWDEHGFGRWAFFDKATGEFVGRGGLRELEIEGVPVVELGYAIAAQRWGEGFATEVGAAATEIGFRDLELEEIVAFSLPDNVASRRVMEKLGFTFDRHFLRNGKDHVLYRIRRDSKSDG